MTLKTITSKFAKAVKDTANERLIAVVFLLLVGAYIVLTGLTSAHGFTIGFNWATFNFSLFLAMMPIFLIDGFKTALESFLPKNFYPARENVSKVTVIIPTYNGSKTLRRTVRDLLKKFKPGRIIVASNGSTDDTVKIARSMGVRVLEITRPVGKVSAINYAMALVRTPYTMIIDDDTLVGNASLATNALDDGYEGVAFRVYPVIENWLSKFQAHEYRKSMDIGKGYQNTTASVQNISGAIGLFLTKELKRQIRLHSGEFAGEDLQRTLLIHLSKHSKGVVITDSIIMTLAPTTVSSLVQQRIFGWNPGMYSNLKHYLSLLFGRGTPLRLRYDAFYNAILMSLLDPFRLIALPALAMYPSVTLAVYASYVLLETIPYFMMRRQEPYWVILGYPIYGIINFLTRVTAFAVFLFRRGAVLFAGKGKPDSYRHAPSLAKWSSVAVTVAFLLTALAFRFTLEPVKAEVGMLLRLQPAPAEVVIPQPIAAREGQIDPVAAVAPERGIGTTTLKVFPGDTYWTLADIAIQTYAYARQIDLAQYDTVRATGYLVQYQDRVNAVPYTDITFDNLNIELALYDSAR